MVLTNKESSRKQQRYEGSESHRNNKVKQSSKHKIETKQNPDNNKTRYNGMNSGNMNMAQSIMDMHNQAQRSRMDMHQMANTQSQTRMVARKDSFLTSCINLPHIGVSNNTAARRSLSCVSCDEDESRPLDANNDLESYENWRTISPTDAIVTKETSICSLSRYPMLPYIDGRHPISPSIQVKHIMGMEQDLQQRQMNAKTENALRHNTRDHSSKTTKLPPIDYVQAQVDEQRSKRASMRASKRGESPETKRVKTNAEEKSLRNIGDEKSATTEEAQENGKTRKRKHRKNK